MSAPSYNILLVNFHISTPRYKIHYAHICTAIMRSGGVKLFGCLGLSIRFCSRYMIVWCHYTFIITNAEYNYVYSLHARMTRKSKE